MLYREGLVVDRNVCMAFAWLKIASKDHNAAAEKGCYELQHLMSESELKLSNDLYRELSEITAEKTS
ncbi:MAG: hypothetical protein HKN08_12195 [Gammaproteobacteria bacterium]|nr:hypothetical protein [Gammaproteobacteria bacterium]